MKSIITTHVILKKKNILYSFKICDLKKLKVIIIGQDPYSGYNQANGLSFSVNNNIKIPKSLHNIYLEIKNSYHSFTIPKHGNLTKWAKQGVLLLNTILTVRKNQPASHKNLGWEIFTSNIIKHISMINNKLVFILWGSYAKKIKKYISNTNNHLILESSHPSPLSAHKGFFGCNHFKKINNFLYRNKKKIIEW
jgi:uracil-DNA glycosylase